MLLLNLDVLASVSIKRKKPWPQITWLGKDQGSIFLLDSHRVSLLNVPSGKTKRQIPKVQPLLGDTQALNFTDNGHYIVGLLVSGDVFVWKKDEGSLQYIDGPSDFKHTNKTTAPRTVHIFASDNVDKLAVVLNTNKMYVWESLNTRDRTRGSLGKRVAGRWYLISHEDQMVFPTDTCKETRLSARFASNQFLGVHLVCVWTFYAEDNLVSIAAILRWRTCVGMTGIQPFTTSWNSITIPLKLQPIKSRGSLVTSLSHDGRITALISNQKQALDTRMMFVGIQSKVIVRVDLGMCGFDSAKKGRNNWIADVCWTADDLFLLFVTKRGSMGLVSRLGQPLVIQSTGCSLELGPGRLLPVHPLISIVSADRVHSAQSGSQSPSSTLSEGDLLRQRFSVSCHPRLPVMLCSDGYLVTIFQLMDGLTDQSLMKELLLSANHELSGLQETDSAAMVTLHGNGTLRQALQTIPINASRIQGSSRKAVDMSYCLEDEHTLDVTMASQVSSVEGDMADCGQIMFGTTGVPVFSPTISHMSVQQTLLSVWGLLVTRQQPWSVSMDTVSNMCADILLKLMLCKYLTAYATTKPEDGLHSVLAVYGQFTALLRFNAWEASLLPTSFKFTNKLVRALIRRCHSEIEVKRKLLALQCVHALLTFKSRELTTSYWLSRDCGNEPCPDLVEPCLVKEVKSSKPSQSKYRTPSGGGGSLLAEVRLPMWRLKKKKVPTATLR